LKRISLEQVEPVPIIAQGVPLRVCGNRIQRLLKRSVEPFGSPQASFGMSL